MVRSNQKRGQRSPRRLRTDIVPGCRFGTDAILIIDPPVATEAGYDELLSWVETRGHQLAVKALSRDAVLISTLTRRGWSYHHSSFGLIRDVKPDWVLASPEWLPHTVTSRNGSGYFYLPL